MKPAKNFVKAVDLWDADIQDKLQSGEMKLTPGQWVRCGQKRCSRYCGVTPAGVFVAAHPEGEKGVTMERFRACLNYFYSSISGESLDPKKRKG